MSDILAGAAPGYLAEISSCARTGAGASSLACVLSAAPIVAHHTRGVRHRSSSRRGTPMTASTAPRRATRTLVLALAAMAALSTPSSGRRHAARRPADPATTRPVCTTSSWSQATVKELGDHPHRFRRRSTSPLSPEGSNAGEAGRRHAEPRPRSPARTARATRSGPPTGIRRRSCRLTGRDARRRSCRGRRPRRITRATASSSRRSPRPPPSCTRARVTCSCPTTLRPASAGRSAASRARSRSPRCPGRTARRASRARVEIISTGDLWKRHLRRQGAGGRTRAAARAPLRPLDRGLGPAQQQWRWLRAGSEPRLRAAARGPRPGLLEVRRPAAGAARATHLKFMDWKDHYANFEGWMTQGGEIDRWLLSGDRPRRLRGDCHRSSPRE